ncbi:MAG: septum formation initiator family protein [Candidatus Omnitrophica bacterium]|nr:septum formation initiator family protein [Candidatus Omnitrophota bacterium]
MAKKAYKTKVLLVIVVLIIIFLPSFARYQELNYKNKRLDERIKFLKSENKRLEEEKARLETDITYIEKSAREKLGVVRKGEIVLKDMSPKR